VHGTRSWLWGAPPALCALAVFSAPLALAAEQPVKVSASVSRASLGVGDSAEIAIEFDIADGWHINGNEPGLEFLIPTTVTFEVPHGLRVEDVRFPEPATRKLELGGDRDLKLYAGRVRVPATLRYESAADGGEPISAVVQYQACNDSFCLRPQKLELSLDLELTAAGTGPAVAEDASAAASLPFETFTAEAYDRVLRARRPFVIEFGAEWCTPCKEMKQRTFTDPRVLRESHDFSFLTVDMTTTDRQKELILESFRVVGAPTTLFFDAGGKEHARRIGFIGPEDFVEMLSKTRRAADAAPAPSGAFSGRGV
jgi:thiol:disulfide interchange protein